ncbi:P1 family peptidase [Actinoplanes regularis]|uniref:P1 family peptidase n=1 Tax=Actinoplanes regularis TaxID=52697 RepID=UPI0024A383F0|nr:P1 family peptidase [Actinoplanes regularis]GLW34196.1 peptidase S58 [Actinoplanes regularis]
MGDPQLLSAYAGNWTGDGTGVTVILPPSGTVGSGEVRGGAPATREFDLLHPVRTVDRVDAVVLSGGSAFGLAAADGVMAVLRERGLGYPTECGPVPIVVGMSIFDTSVAGTPPSSAAGRDAALAALRGEEFLVGTAGAGAGARTGKWRGRSDPGGLGRADGRAGPARVTALAVVNAWGDVLAPDGRLVFGGDPADQPGARFGRDSATQPGARFGPGGATQPGARFGRENTTIAVLLTDARLSKSDCHLLAQSGHDGFARALHPAHSRHDGDAVVALATGEVTAEVDLDLLRAVATDVMARAIRAAVS